MSWESLVGLGSDELRKLLRKATRDAQRANRNRVAPRRGLPRQSAITAKARSERCIAQRDRLARALEMALVAEREGR